MVKLILIILSAATNCVSAEQYTPMIGYEAINIRIRSRLMVKDTIFNIGQYLDSKDLIDILRPRYGDGLINEDRTGRPSKINLLLWHVIAHGLAKDLAQMCNEAQSTTKGLVLNEQFSSILREACRAPKTETTLRQMWLALMGFSAPQGEYVAWKEFVKSAPLGSNQDRVKDMLIALFFNPYFLLKL